YVLLMTRHANGLEINDQKVSKSTDERTLYSASAGLMVGWIRMRLNNMSAVHRFLKFFVGLVANTKGGGLGSGQFAG
ncbi:MAG: hypothetical protein U5L02_18080, partial [Rheinheimera sp.]|nr:hypothetical protein [Rheinheimera sp.]